MNAGASKKGDSRIVHWIVEHVELTAENLLLAIFFVLGMGIVFSISGYPTGFQRSGCLLVSIAVFSVYFNHIVMKEIQNNEGYLDRSGRLYGHKAQMERSTRLLTALNKEEAKSEQIREERRKEITDRMVSGFRSRSEKQRVLQGKRELSKYIVEVEFSAGVVGTLVWGFGDVPFV